VTRQSNRGRSNCRAPNRRRIAQEARSRCGKYAQIHSSGIIRLAAYPPRHRHSNAGAKPDSRAERLHGRCDGLGEIVKDRLHSNINLMPRKSLETRPVTVDSTIAGIVEGRVSGSDSAAGAGLPEPPAQSDRGLTALSYFGAARSTNR